MNMFEFIKKLVLAWDPDYTKVTHAERKALEDAEKDIAENGTISHDAINWDQGAIKITTIQQKVKAACNIAGITQTELGKKMGMSQQTFSSRLKVGKFSQDEYVKMSEILGCKYVCQFEFPNGQRVQHYSLI